MRFRNSIAIAIHCAIFVIAKRHPNKKSNTNTSYHLQRHLVAQWRPIGRLLGKKEQKTPLKLTHNKSAIDWSIVLLSTDLQSMTDSRCQCLTSFYDDVYRLADYYFVHKIQGQTNYYCARQQAAKCSLHTVSMPDKIKCSMLIRLARNATLDVLTNPCLKLSAIFDIFHHLSWMDARFFATRPNDICPNIQTVCIINSSRWSTFVYSLIRHIDSVHNKFLCCLFKSRSL